MLLLSAEVTIRCAVLWCAVMWCDVMWCDSISNHIKFICCILSIPFPCRSDIRIILKYLRKDSFILLLWYFFWELFFEFLPPVVSHLQKCDVGKIVRLHAPSRHIIVFFKSRILFDPWLSIVSEFSSCPENCNDVYVPY